MVSSKAKHESKEVLKEVRITDPYILRLVGVVQSSRGNNNPTKTAGQLIIERCAQLGIEPEQSQSEHPEPASA